ncbi:amidohydrolase [Methylocapsa sp. S129]|uniref:amidohydrolase n=1 Tax=Methylocapsa sp. S129 TaxID=1641869 RepID=UPI00131D00A3|nr:amidohydrolase [Methylocapsa sp. S129]
MKPASIDLLRCRLAGRNGLFDVAVREGFIQSIAEAGVASPQQGAPIENLDGLLLLPALTDGHIHLDKTFLGLEWMPHISGASIGERIEAERRQRQSVGVPIVRRAGLLIERILGLGTLALRSHVDVSEEIGLAHLAALLDVRQKYADLVDIQFVAFPQSGINSRVAELMDEALRLGAEVVGGLDPAGIDGDVEGHLDTVFGLAERHDCRVDIHLHDPGSLGAFELRQIANRSAALGLQGRVAVSHAFALGMIDGSELRTTLAALARGGVAIMTNGPGPDAIPPVARLAEAGVTVFAGSDNIRDAWSPFGSGDLLERARMIAYRANLRMDGQLRLAFELITTNSRKVLGLSPVAVEVGGVADLIAVAAGDVPEAVASFPPRRIVLKRGAIVARDGRVNVAGFERGEDATRAGACES